MIKKRRRTKQVKATTGMPCPKCGSPSKVLRTSLGERLKTTPRNYVLRERRCVSPAKHRFHTEERSR